MRVADASNPDEPAHFVGRWVRVEVHRVCDQRNAGADKEFRWFVRTYTERSNNDKDIKDPQELLLVGLVGSEMPAGTIPFQAVHVHPANALRGRRERSELVKEPLWQAEYQAGTLLLEKQSGSTRLSRCFARP